MADFDAQQAQQHAHQNQFDHDQARIACLEQNISNMSNTLLNMQNRIPAPVPQQILTPISICHPLLPILALLFSYLLSK